MQEMQEIHVRSWVGKIPWRRKWQPTPVSLPGKSRGQRSLVGYSPWDHRVGHDWAHTHINIFNIISQALRSATVLGSAANSCSTLYDPRDCSSPGSSVHETSQQEFWSELPFPSPGIFSTQGSNLSLLWLLHCGQILYRWGTGEAHPSTTVPAELGLTRIPQANLTTNDLLR